MTCIFGERSSRAWCVPKVTRQPSQPPWGKKKKEKKEQANQTPQRTYLRTWCSSGQVNPRDENPLGSNASGSRPRCHLVAARVEPSGKQLGPRCWTCPGQGAAPGRGVPGAAGGQVAAPGCLERLELCSASAGFAPCCFNLLLDTSGLCSSQFCSLIAAKTLDGRSWSGCGWDREGIPPLF